MKKQLFSLVMMLALVIVAGSAMAINETSVLPGGTYRYVLSGVYSANNATASVSYATTGTGVTIAQVANSYAIVGGATATSVTFDITYGTQTAPSASGVITVLVTDGTSVCSNSIELDITVLALPIYTLTITKDETNYLECQTRTGADNNLTDARGTEANTFKYTVTPTIENTAGNFTYSYKITLPDGAVLTDFNNGSGDVTGYSGGVVTRSNVSSATPDVFTVTFKTTTGKATQTLTATLDETASNLVPVNGGGTYVASMTSGGSLTQSVTVKAVPTIGSFVLP